MIDLRANDDALFIYARRYAHLIPQASRQLMNRMSYEQKPLRAKPEDALKPEWAKSLPQKITDEQALDKCRGALMGLAVGDAIGTTLEFMPRDKARVDDMIGGDLFLLKPVSGLMTPRWRCVSLKLILKAINVILPCSEKATQLV